MSKYCVMASLQFVVPSQWDNLSVEIKDKIIDKLTSSPKMPIWGDLGLGCGVNEQGNSASSLIVRFDNKADMESVFDFLKDRMVKIPVLKGRVSKHICHHDDDSNTPCEIWETYVKE